MVTSICQPNDRYGSDRRWWRKKRIIVPLAVAALLAMIAGLFVINGVVLANNERPFGNTTEQDLAGESGWKKTKQLKVMSYNIAKGFLYKGGISFRDPADVRQRMLRIARLINDEQSDLVFLSEAVTECHPCPVNQVELLARETGLDYWVFGENYNFGLPFYRIVGGNAILARFSIRPASNPSLAGRQPFYVVQNNRRALWCQLDLGHRKVLLGSVHNDSFNLKNNLRQTAQLLDYGAGKDVVMAGDFNANPDEPPIELIRASDRFVGVVDGPMTFPSNGPDQTIDFVFAPRDWTLIDHKVIRSDCSDHLPVVSTFRLP